MNLLMKHLHLQGEGPAPAPASGPAWLHIDWPICITSWLRAAIVSLISCVDPLPIMSLSSCSLGSTFSFTSPGIFSPNSLSCFSVWYTTESAWFFVSIASLFCLSPYILFDTYHLCIMVYSLTNIWHSCQGCIYFKKIWVWMLLLSQRKKFWKNEQNKRKKIQLFIHIHWRYAFVCYKQKEKIHSKRRCTLLR